MRRIWIEDAMIDRALAGEAAARGEIVRVLQGPFVDLARRIVLDPGDAEDAPGLMAAAERALTEARAARQA